MEVVDEQENSQQHMQVCSDCSAASATFSPSPPPLPSFLPSFHPPLSAPFTASPPPIPPSHCKTRDKKKNTDLVCEEDGDASAGNTRVVLLLLPCVDQATRLSTRSLPLTLLPCLSLVACLEYLLPPPPHTGAPHTEKTTGARANREIGKPTSPMHVHGVSVALGCRRR